MDKAIFVQNVKKTCELKGIKPTVACRESGVGTSFINNIEARGQVPSVEKVQMLAAYLGVTTSELLGEQKEPAPVAESGQKLNVIKIAGRDGSFLERTLTDEQLAALKALVDQLPDAEDL